jgi:hypothetical protein
MNTIGTSIGDKNRIRRAAIAVALAAGVLSLGASVASAGTPINPVQGGVVHGCFRSTSGRNLRLIDPTQPTGACTGGETPLQWGQQGPKGDPGAKGDTGPKGDTGAAGAPGLSEYEVVPVSQPIPAAGGWVFEAACPNGKTAISGGYTLPGGSTVTESHPRDGDPTVWRLAFTVPGSTTIKLYLQCARTQ